MKIYRYVGGNDVNKSLSFQKIYCNLLKNIKFYDNF